MYHLPLNGALKWMTDTALDVSLANIETGLGIHPFLAKYTQWIAKDLSFC